MPKLMRITLLAPPSLTGRFFVGFLGASPEMPPSSAPYVCLRVASTQEHGKDCKGSGHDVRMLVAGEC